jgi:hypothetical protein
MLIIVAITGAHAGFMTLESPKGSTSIIKRSDRFQFPLAIKQFVRKMVQLLHISYNAREIIVQGIKLIDDSHATIGGYSLKRRKAPVPPCLTSEKVGSSSSSSPSSATAATSSSNKKGKCKAS